MPAEDEPDVDHRKRGLDAIPPLERSIEDGHLRETRAFRGLTLEQAVRYLENLGGERTSDTAVEGDAWEAHLSTRKVSIGPSYRLTEVVITWSGRQAALEPIIFRFRLKAFRAPG